MRHAIHLVRHLPSAQDAGGRLSAAQFADWSQRYDDVGLAAGATPTAELVTLAARCTVLSSPLPRAVATARLALPGHPAANPPNPASPPTPASPVNPASPASSVPTVLPVLARVVRPDVKLPLVRLRPWTWRAVTRVAWHHGWTRAVETPAQARRRAALAADTLATRAAGAELLVVGHNYFNSLIAAALHARGWAGPLRPSGGLGAVTTYLPPAVPRARPALALPRPRGQAVTATATLAAAADSVDVAQLLLLV